MENRISDHTHHIVRSLDRMLIEATREVFTPPSDARFISLTALEPILEEAASAYSLCDDGLNDFKRSVGLLPNTLDMVQVVRVDSLRIEFTAPPGTDLTAIVSPGELDGIIQTALDTELRARAARHADRNITGIDAYSDVYLEDPEVRG